MAITTSICNSFLGELLGGVHDLDTHTIKMALIKPSMSGTYNDETTNYSDVTGTSDELSGTGYTTGGKLLTSVTPTADGTTAITNFSAVTWTSSSFTTCGGLIYDTTDSNSACAVLSFGGDQTVSTGDFQIQFPAAAAATAIIRIA